MPELAEKQANYFGFMADIGHTKHIGGLAATDALAAICRLKTGDLLLDVGCGVGIGPAYFVKEYGCFVEGVDFIPKMIKRAEDRARRLGVAPQTTFRVADMHALPYPDNFFDAAVAESVLTFSPNPLNVVKELARVVKPGRSIAFTEAIWVKLPPPDKRNFMAESGGFPQGLLTNEEWAAIMAQSGLVDVVAEGHSITAREDSRNQAKRISFGDYMRTTGRSLNTMFKPQYRAMLMEARNSMPKGIYDHMGYGVYGGRVVE